MPADDVLGHALKDVLPADAFAEMQGYIERAFAGATVTYERRERQLEGERALDARRRCSPTASWAAASAARSR